MVLISNALYKEELKNNIYNSVAKMTDKRESVDALESIALGHQEFNQPEARLQLQRSNKQKIEIFSLSLYLHQTLKRIILNEIWVKIFLPNPL